MIKKVISHFAVEITQAKKGDMGNCSRVLSGHPRKEKSVVLVKGDIFDALHKHDAADQLSDAMTNSIGSVPDRQPVK